MPNLPAEWALKEKVVDGFRSLITEGARICILEAMAMPPIGCPNPAMQCQLEENFDLWRRRRFPELRSTPHICHPNEERPVCRGCGVGTILSPSPDETIGYRWLQIDLLQSFPEGDIFNQHRRLLRGIVLYP